MKNSPRIKKSLLIMYEGNYSIVDRVKLESGDQVVRKTFKPKKEVDQSTIQKLRNRFIIEVKTQEKLPHDIFIPILFSDLEGENPWYIMPIANRVYTDEIQMARMEHRPPEGLSDILNSMEILHQLEYVHRDIKPQNILYHDGRWKLSDFGLISTSVTILSQFSTSEGDRGGTEMYMAPEQFKNFKHATPQSDIYSFGAILHDIFDGGPRIPYSCLTSVGKMGFIIKKCTEENPRNRYPSVSALRSILLTTIDKISSGDSDPSAEIWINKLESYLTWEEEDFEQFTFGIDRLESPRNVFVEINKEILTHLKGIDPHHWKNLVLSYLDWLRDSKFLYDFCDVLIGRILKIYELSNSIEIKCSCIITAAKLGVRHNRWFVMHRVIKMAGSDISDNLAQRLAIELEIDSDAMNDFKRCIFEVSLKPSNCHPIISNIIS